MTTIQSMIGARSTSDDQQALKAGAHELQRAAGKVLEHACAAEDPLTLGVALAHIEEALGFHLRLAAERLCESQLACQSSRFWTRRMIASAPHTAAGRRDDLTVDATTVGARGARGIAPTG